MSKNNMKYIPAIVVAILCSSLALNLTQQTGWSFKDAFGIPDWLALLGFVVLTAFIAIWAKLRASISEKE